MKKFKITLEETKEVFRLNLPKGIHLKQDGKMIYVTAISALDRIFNKEFINRIAYEIAIRFKSELVDLKENCIFVSDGFSCDIIPQQDPNFNDWAFFAPIKETVQPINKTQEDIIETIFNQVQHG